MPQPTSSTRSSGRSPHSATRCERNSSPIAPKSPSPTDSCIRRGGTSRPPRPASRSRAASGRSRGGGEPPPPPPREPVARVERPQPQGGARSPRLGAAWHRAGPYNRGLMTPSHRLPEPDRPWMMRTYSGHSTAQASNALYRSNLAKGQTGLSIAFDLPTQTGYDPDHELARGEVGKV